MPLRGKFPPSYGFGIVVVAIAMDRILVFIVELLFHNIRLRRQRCIGLAPPIAALQQRP